MDLNLYIVYGISIYYILLHVHIKNQKYTQDTYAHITVLMIPMIVKCYFICTVMTRIQSIQWFTITIEVKLTYYLLYGMNSHCKY